MSEADESWTGKSCFSHMKEACSCETRYMEISFTGFDGDLRYTVLEETDMLESNFKTNCSGFLC